MASVYLAGPIEGLHYDGCTSWREYATQELGKDGIIGVSPMRAKEFLEGKVIEGDQNHVMATDKAITTRDRFDVEGCDVMLVNFLGAKRVSVGTCVEFGWADTYRKPVVMCMEESGNFHDHAMIREIAAYRVTSLDEGIQVVKSVLIHSGKIRR